MRASGTRGGLHLLVGSGDKLSGGKNKNRERVRRDKQMSWRTVYFFYLKMGKKFATDLDGVAAGETGVVEGSIVTANEIGVAMGGGSEPME